MREPMQFSRLLFCFIFSAGYPLVAEQLKISIQAEAAILMNAETGQILYEKNAHKVLYPASLTKIPTVAYALREKKQDLSKLIAAEKDAIGTISEEERRRAKYKTPPHLLGSDSSHIGLKKGEELSLLDLMYGTMLASGGDSSNVIAQYVGGTIPQFMEKINSYLKSIGCKNTYFNNPHGRHHPDHVTTAYDVALMTKDALKDPTFCEIVKTVRYPRKATKMQKASTFLQTNKLLRKGALYYEKAIGVKTGHTSQAGYSLASAAEHEGRKLIAVVLKSEDSDTRFREAAKLFEAAFNQPKVKRTLLAAGSQSQTLKLEGGKKPVSTYTTADLSIEYYPAETPQVQCLLYWDQVKVPIVKGQRVGEYRVMDDSGKVLQKAALFAQDNVEPTFMHKLKKNIQENRNTVKILGASVILLFFGMFALQLRRR